MLALIPIFAAVVFPPTIAKSFSPVTIGVSETSTMTIVISNPNTSDLTNARMEDFFPADLTNVGPGTSTCPGSDVIITTSGQTHLTFFGNLPANGNCTIRVLVTAALPGSYENHTGAVFSSGPASLGGG